MSLQIIRHQCAFGLKQKTAIFTFYLLLALSLMNFASNVFEFQGWDLVDMYHPAKLVLLSYNRTLYQGDTAELFVNLYPVLVACPAGFLLLSEKNRREDVLLIERIGAARYYFYGLVSAFIITAIVFILPSLLELLLSCISFPLSATGDFWGGSLYDPYLIEMTQQYQLFGLYEWNHYVYMVVGILFMGFFSGIMGMFTAALSLVMKVRYKVFMILPVYILLNLAMYQEAMIREPLPFSIKWFDYVFFFNYTAISGWFMVGFLAILCIVSIGCAWYKSRCDRL